MTNRRLLASNRTQLVIGYLALVVASGSLLWALLASLAAGQLAAAGALAFLILSSFAVCWRVLHRRIPKDPRSTEVFRPFTPLDADTVWRRPVDVTRIVTAIFDCSSTIPLVVGSSGVGKSTLLDVMVREYLTESRPDLRYVLIDTYADVRPTLVRFIKERSPKEHLVIVLDQFEQWLGRSRLLSRADRAQEQEWLAGVLKDSGEAASYTILLSVRREWYYDLRFLGSLVPAPVDACDIQEPLTTDDADEMRQEILGSFMRVLSDTNVSGRLLTLIGPAGRLSPLKAQIVGAVVEWHRVNGRRIDVDYFESIIGGTDQAIDSYFEAVLDGAERRDICLKVLCALSVKTRFRQEMELGDILGSFFEDTATVQEAVKYLAERGLIRERGIGYLDLAHDYLAEYFNSKSGADLNPIERDNIHIHAETGGLINRDVLLDQAIESDAKTHVRSRLPLGRIVVVPLLVIMVVRLLDFGINWTLVGPSIAHTVKKNFLDTSYIPIFVPHAAWVIYIALFYDRIFRRINESRSARLFSIVVVVNLIISIGVGIFIPFAWLASIATGGVVLGLKLLALSRRPDLNRTARERLTVFGGTTLFNLLFLACLGVGDLYASLHYVHTRHAASTWVAVNVGLSAMMTYACLVLAPIHVSRSGMSQLLGLMARPRRIVVAHEDKVHSEAALSVQ
jgi:hypothetical protein